MAKAKYDFSGYATKNNIKCTDGRTILKDAFKHNDGQVVPLVWQHLHDSPENVLGHALLENREDGVYTYASFNDSVAATNAKEAVKHGDITMMSIYANDLKQKGNEVLHGSIREVSLVMAGANPGAKIENLNFAHSDGSLYPADDEAIIYTGVKLSSETVEHGDDPDPDPNKKDDKPKADNILDALLKHAADQGKSVQEIFETLNEEQRTVVYAMVGRALAVDGGELDHSNLGKEGDALMKNNVFDGSAVNAASQRKVLSHDQFQVIMNEAEKTGSFKKAILAHATEYGIENIDVLFPDAQTLSRDPDWLKREDSWVQTVLNAIHKSPFSRVKSILANMDFDAARARGYVKATEKKETYFKASKRVVTPTTVYVKQKLDRDDIIDVTDFDIVAMVRFELRTLLNEELARAALIGDGRDLADPDKISEENIIPIWKDLDLYAIKEELTTKTDYKKMVKEISLTHVDYKGSGNPVLYTTSGIHTNMLWIEDNNGRRIYESDATLCAALRVSAIVEIPQLEGKTRVLEDGSERELLGIKVNLGDYNFGADNGGQIASFDDFDIDFNQYKYLMETRCSGALTKPYSAQIFEFETKAAAQG